MMIKRFSKEKTYKDKEYGRGSINKFLKLKCRYERNDFFSPVEKIEN